MSRQDYFVGEIRLFAFQNVPIDWLPCDGSLKYIKYYSALFSLLGTKFGGDGQSQFGLPDLRGRVPIGQGAGPLLPTYSIGAQGGQESVVLKKEQMPTHSHALQSTRNVADVQAPSPRVHFATNNPNEPDRLLYAAPDSAAPYVVMAPAISDTGNNQGHPNMMPSLVGNYCICWNGQYPIRP